MKPSSLNTAVGVLFAVVGASNAAGLKRFGRRTHQHDPRHHQLVDADNSTSSGSSDITTATATSDTTSSLPYLFPNSTSTVVVEPECTLEVVTITTTVDVITTITAPPSDAPSSTNMPEAVNTTSCTEQHGWNTSITASAHSTFLSAGVSTSEPCTTEKVDPTWALNSTTTTAIQTLFPNSTITLSTSTKEPPCTDDESMTSIVEPTVTSSTASHATEPPCTDDESRTSTVDPAMTSLSTSATTEPCTDDGSATTSAAADATWTESSTSFTVTPFPTPSTLTSTQTTVLIDTSMTPITVAATYTAIETVTNTLPPTTTVCETSAPTGTPAPRAVHCGVHGLPVGDFFLGRFVEERATVPVSLEGCWEFCKTAWGATNGCSSYDYYINELGAPRCDLYSSRVAFALDKIDNNQPNLWFDLDCGNPTDPKWSHSHNETARSIRGSRRA